VPGGIIQKPDSVPECRDGAMESAVRRGVKPEGWKGVYAAMSRSIGVIKNLYIHSWAAWQSGDVGDVSLGGKHE
jgi:hypothetical protein